MDPLPSESAFRNRSLPRRRLPSESSRRSRRRRLSERPDSSIVQLKIPKIDICQDPIFNKCSLVPLNDPKWFEKRNACIYEYLKKKYLDPNIERIQSKLEYIIESLNKKLKDVGVKESELYRIDDKDVSYKILNDIYPIYDQVMAISILLSFTDEKDITDIRYLSVSYEEIINTKDDISTNVLPEIFGDERKEDDNKNFIKKLEKSVDEIIECNKKWNNSIINTLFFEDVKDKLNLRRCHGNKFYNKLKTEISFLEEIMGVIDKSDYVIRQEKYYDNEKGLLDIEDNIDEICKNFEEKECRENIPQCQFRKGTCINKQRHSSARPDMVNIQSYYILNNFYRSYNIQEPLYYLYIPLNNYYTVAGYSGIFEKKHIVQLGPYKKAISKEPKQISIVFPPFDSRGEGTYIQNIKTMWNGIYNFGLGRSMTIKEFEFNGNNVKVGVLHGLFETIVDWYKKAFIPLVENGTIKYNSEIFITGTSLGGALTNLCAFYLRINGFTNIHYYANGAPRVGNKEFKEFMETKDLFRKDSGNFVRYINVIKTKDNGTKEFLTEFDPVCKFPPEDTAIPYKAQIGSYLPSFFNPFQENYRISDNPNLTVVESGLLFNPYIVGYEEQPDFEMALPSYRKGINLGMNCSNHWDYIHSIPAYTSKIFNGDDTNKGVMKYAWNYDAVRDLQIYPCMSEEISESRLVNLGIGMQGMKGYSERSQR
jgi:hypothetical protein